MLVGFAMAAETAAAPITAFLVAPLADRWIIPYAASASGRESLEPLLGVGTPVSRGIALVFVYALIYYRLLGLVMIAWLLVTGAFEGTVTDSRTGAAIARCT